MPNNICPTCGGVMVYDTRPDALVYREHRRYIQTLGWWCDACGECILYGEPLKDHEAAFQKLKAEVEQEYRHREKQASRLADAEALASGQKDRNQLRKENTLIKIKQIDWKNIRAPKH